MLVTIKASCLSLVDYFVSDLFKFIDFETCSACNRYCVTCIRNSHPERDKVQSWFEKNYLPIGVIRQALDQCAELGFTGGVCLSHYNEPLMDERIPKIIRLAKSYPQFKEVFMNSNGDFLTEELAREIDGSGLDRIIVSLYMDEPIKSQRAAWIKTLFTYTEPVIITMSDHIATHFSPKFDVEALTEKYIDNPCGEPAIRVIINHRQQYLACCDDVIGNFDMGTFPETSIGDHWFGGKRQSMIINLREHGGRRKYAYCSTCPRR